MQQLYEKHFGVGVLHPMARTMELGDIIRMEIENSRDSIVAQMEADDANPRHYLFTVHSFAGSLAYQFHMTAERHPDNVIEYIEGAGYKNEKI